MVSVQRIETIHYTSTHIVKLASNPMLITAVLFITRSRVESSRGSRVWRGEEARK